MYICGYLFFLIFPQTSSLPLYTKIKEEPNLTLSKIYTLLLKIHSNMQKERGRIYTQILAVVGVCTFFFIMPFSTIKVLLLSGIKKTCQEIFWFDILSYYNSIFHTASWDSSCHTQTIFIL